MAPRTARGPLTRRAATTRTFWWVILIACSAACPAFPQNPILEAIQGSGAAEVEAIDAPTDGVTTDADPLRAIEAALASARQRHNALEDARPSIEGGQEASPSASLEWAGRLVRVLEERREAQIQSNELKAGREAIETLLQRDPSEFFGDPPPFPVPILDGVLESWRDAVEREEQHAIVLEDRRANAALAKKQLDELEKDRRRLRDRLQKEDDELERVRLESEARRQGDEVAVAREQVALATQRLANTELEYEIKRIATRQAKAARTWIEAHLEPEPSDLAEALERIDRQRFQIDRKIDLARTRLLDIETSLRAAEERRVRAATGGRDPVTEIELATLRSQLGYRQHLVAMLNQKVERLGRMRTTWQNRYAVLGGEFDFDRAPDWRVEAEQELERLTRSRRIGEAELASLQLELANLLRMLSNGKAGNRDANPWRERERNDLESLVGAYESDLESLDEAIRLEERLRAELDARFAGRDLGERVRGAVNSLRGFWSYEITTSEDSPITPGKILIALFVIAGGYIFARILVRWLGHRFFPRLGFDSGASDAFASLSFYGLLAVVFLLALRAVNIPLTAFAVVGGALALGIGFGSQAMVSNFISGLLLLAERPIRMGDLIEVGGVVGNVESIGLRSTRIRTPDNFHIIVPNSSFLESSVINWTHEDPLIRIRIAVGVAYGSDVREVERLLIQAVTEHPRVQDRPEPMVYFEDFADSALAFEVRFWIRYDRNTDRSLVRSDIRFRIDQLFAENGIVIAFPQIDVHFDGVTNAYGGSPTRKAAT